MENSGKREEPLQKAQGDARWRIAHAGERAAADYLIGLGYTELKHNWRTGRFAELDLIFRDSDGTVIFTEVKTRQGAGSNESINAALESITWRKRRKIILAAKSFAAQCGAREPDLRIDVAVVSFERVIFEADRAKLHGLQVFHIPDAFTSV